MSDHESEFAALEDSLEAAILLLEKPMPRSARDIVIRKMRKQMTASGIKRFGERICHQAQLGVLEKVLADAGSDDQLAAAFFAKLDQLRAEPAET